MGELSITQIVIVLVIALLVFGPKRLPELGRQIGKGLRELRSHASSVGHELAQAVDDTPEPSGRNPVAATAPAPAQGWGAAGVGDDELLDGVVVQGTGEPAGRDAVVEEPDELLDGVVVSGATPPVRRTD